MHSSALWENFVDRLDLFIKQSFLIIQCNENEVQIARHFKTYEEFQSNFQCTNKNQLFEHGIDKVQIIDFRKILKNCENNKILRLTSHFYQVKTSVSKEENGVDWPFFHTPYTKNILKSNPEEIDLSNKKEMKIILADLNIDEFPVNNEKLFIHLEFLNRPLLCRIRLTISQNKSNDGTCHPDLIKKTSEPVCYYKVGGKRPPTDEDLNPILDQTFSYATTNESPYTYRSNINTFTNEDNQSEDSIEDIDSSNGKDQDSDLQLSPNKKKKKKKKSNLFLIMFIILICLILLSIGLFIFYRKYSSKKANKQFKKPGSDSSLESEITESFDFSNSIRSKQDVSSNTIKQIQDETPKGTESGRIRMYKFDDEL